MQIVCVSRGSQSRGAEFANKLAAKLGFECISREQILEEATRRGIPIGKIETAIIKPQISSEKLALELEHYKALATSIICEKAMKNNVVYHGRTGHLLLSGIDHILKLRVVADMDRRIESVIKDLGLSWKKAEQYIEQVDEDRRKWVKKFYNIDWDVFTLYDFIINLSQTNVDNAAGAVCHIVGLPEFQPTPASTAALKDLCLASKARLLLADDERTADLNVRISVSRGVIVVTYLYHQAEKASLIMSVLGELPDVKEIVCTQAQTGLMWIQESFDIDETAYSKVLSLAGMWNAAVELVKISPEAESEKTIKPGRMGSKDKESWLKNGVIDSDEEIDDSIPEDVSKIYEKLLNDGRAGGRRVVPYSQKALVGTIGNPENYRLIVFDNVFLDKGESARKRLRQEWSNFLFNTTRTPVVTMGELSSLYRFGVKQAIQMLVGAVITALVVFLTFNYNQEIISFFTKDEFKWRVIGTVGIVIFVPLFAYIYSTVTGLFLKLIKLD